MKVITQYTEKNRDLKYQEIIYADIETIINDQGNHDVVCVAIIYGEKEIVFDSVNEFMEYILKIKKVIIYFHNFGRFDSTFILKYIVGHKSLEKTIGNVNIIERNNIIYEILLSKNKVSFRDSLLIIPISLEKIGLNFCDINRKDDFDYSLMSDYVRKDREKVKNLCLQDCRVLKEGFEKFSYIINERFNIKLHTQLTLPSLAFNIFRKEYYSSLTTPISKNPYDIDEFIRRSYKGGIAEVYKPVLDGGYCYDVNSLYPFVMKSNKFPIGKGEFVKGNEIDINKFIGFIECNIKTDKSLDYLTYKDKEKGLITPNGEWTCVYTHIEIKRALELGYEIEFIKGFKYKYEDKIFDKFVDYFYKMRKESKSKETNNIAKLIMNSLYGRFGMKLISDQSKFVKGEEIEKMKEQNIIRNIEPTGNDYYIVSYNRKLKNDVDKYAKTIDTETAIQIASFITAYARDYMYDFKRIENNQCYYSDTDSIFVRKKLDSKFVGDELGMFKLEYEIDKAYFIAPKVYYVLKIDGEEKIVMKGFKKKEYESFEVLKTFKDIIYSRKINVIINRVNNFKRNFSKVSIGVNNVQLIPKFPFNKRNKIVEKGI